MMLRAVLAMSVLASLGACLEAEPAPVTTGLSIPLTAPGPAGTTYFLRNATFEISLVGSAAASIVLEAPEGDAYAMLSIDPGVYQVALRDGWQMMHLGFDGVSSVPVEALLASNNPQQAAVFPNIVVATTFEFLLASEQGGLQIAMGARGARTLSADLQVRGRTVVTGDDFLAAYEGARLGFTMFYDVASQTTSTATGVGVRAVNFGLIVPRLSSDTNGTLSQVLTAAVRGERGGLYTLADAGNELHQVTVSAGFESSGSVAFGVAFAPFLREGILDQNGIPVDPTHFTGTTGFTLEVQRGQDHSILTGNARLDASPAVDR